MKTEKEKILTDDMLKRLREAGLAKELTALCIHIRDTQRKAGKAEAINKEINMQCLDCGVSLYREIMDKKIHIHLCKECRMKYLEEQSSGDKK